ncbi:amidase, Asp-tRNAAsn/Glu-tRNAGln amidotransferase A subunit [Natronococcus occultus SP4]|uniref:Amidase, Asp-tRNAAsn/Glu-tRNAGln amidotransferase A subunit n=1 Tax=Natronococcus occultus SP4 TaxID=694430 RepID=L0JZZ9_9EURY|nr:amidase, Asp-tRNAAsn/Glu-tRNAGln amidotransferase A subunit [Natronococcus occultus SP4]
MDQADGNVGDGEHSSPRESSRRNVLRAGGAVLGASILAGYGADSVSGGDEDCEFDPIEASARSLRSDYERGNITAESVVKTYLDRIEAYDDELDSILAINPNVLERAKELDRKVTETGELAGPLHGIPVTVKDNIETDDMATTGGAVVMDDYVPDEDATLVERIREAGGIVLAKTNLDEFAFGYDGVSSIGGATKNPYDRERFAGGSSGGSGAATAANLTMLSVGTDTGGSVRVPASACSLVGLRPTTGLVSREGIIPLALNDDTAGPMTRTVEDAALLLDAMVGYDPADDRTVKSDGELPHDGGKRYVDSLDEDGLHGAGIGVYRAFVGPGPLGAEADEPDDKELAADMQEVTDLFDAALEEMAAAGATVVDPVDPPSADRIGEVNTDTESEYSRDKGDYLDGIEADGAPSDIEEILESGEYSPGNCPTLERRAEVDGDATDEDLEYRYALSEEPALRREVLKPMVENDLDALVFPTLIQSPPRIDAEEGWGANAQFTPPLDFPSMTVPIGFTDRTGMPAGIEIVVPRFEEARLFELAYAYEQATEHRSPPSGYGPVDDADTGWSRAAIEAWNEAQPVEETVAVLGCDAPADPDGQ